MTWVDQSAKVKMKSNHQFSTNLPIKKGRELKQLIYHMYISRTDSDNGITGFLIIEKLSVIRGCMRLKLSFSDGLVFS